MADTWHPGIRRDVLPGRSEAELAGLSLGATVAGMTAAVLVLVLLFLDAGLWVWALVPSAVAVAGIAAGGLLDRSAARRQVREARAGYTTVATQQTDLEHVDARTGLLVRHAGELLTTYELQVRLSRVRAAR
ncbi:hypothetical protein [Promicromonospora sp. MEB111]|uniref:hypothetical protein n=1 Tax=Promicromonospora sp. MEB111 TaxID=3040301 RepID=UPI00254C201B|nr:hypothetical protein [Promicromonospora sp. MEB111]